MDEPQTYFVQWKKPCRRDHILSDFIYGKVQKSKVYEKENRLVVPEREETDGGEKEQGLIGNIHEKLYCDDENGLKLTHGDGCIIW